MMQVIANVFSGRREEKEELGANILLQCRFPTPKVKRDVISVKEGPTFNVGLAIVG